MEVVVSGTQVRLELTGWDVLWAFKSNISFPVESVYNVYADLKPGFYRNWWEVIRAPGTSVPNVIQAGTYYWHGEREFWCVYYTGRSVVFELEGFHYNRVVVDVRDPEAVVRAVRAAW